MCYEVLDGKGNEYRVEAGGIKEKSIYCMKLEGYVLEEKKRFCHCKLPFLKVRRIKVTTKSWIQSKTKNYEVKILSSLWKTHISTWNLFIRWHAQNKKETKRI